jgi:hypothetical protein
MEDVAITSRELVQVMYDPETGPTDVEEIRQFLRDERLVEVPLAFALEKRRAAWIKVYCRVLWVVIALALPLGVAKEIWSDLWLTWMIAGVIWSVVVLVMLGVFFVLVRSEEKRAR